MFKIFVRGEKRAWLETNKEKKTIIEVATEKTQKMPKTVIIIDLQFGQIL